PALSGLGIYLVGTQRALVYENHVRDNVPSGRTVASGGIVGVEPAGDNHIVYNHAFGNKAFDISWSGAIKSGSGNILNGNHCGTSSPSSICD
ncbi:MAG TPA: hypothetical protein VF984_05625, partial [Actinomycetota bacterium]